MATGFYKSLVFAGSVGFLAACGGAEPSSPSGTVAGSSGGGSTSAGTAGIGGSSGAAGGVTVAGGGVGGGTGGSAAGAATGGGGAAGAGGALGGSAGQAMGGSGGVAGSAGSVGAGGVAGAAGNGGAGGAGGTAPFVLTSPAFTQVEACAEANHTPCMIIPLKNEMTAIGGQNISPELDWGAGPAGTLSYVITLHDFSNNFTHWAMWNIPTTAPLKLPEMLARDAMPAVPAGSQQISFNKINNQPDPGYMGPGAKDHIYEFRLYALKVAKFTPQDATDQGKIYNELETDTAKIVLGKSMLRGRSTPN